MSWLNGLANGSLVESHHQTRILSLPHIGSNVVVRHHHDFTILVRAVRVSFEPPCRLASSCTWPLGYTSVSHDWRSSHM
jgi:hypothetical protein